jgi:hypothetical protein
LQGRTGDVMKSAALRCRPLDTEAVSLYAFTVDNSQRGNLAHRGGRPGSDGITEILQIITRRSLSYFGRYSGLFAQPRYPTRVIYGSGRGRQLSVSMSLLPCSWQLARKIEVVHINYDLAFTLSSSGRRKDV